MSTQSNIIAEAVPASEHGDWLETWKPEDPSFWARTGSRTAWYTLLLTTVSLVLSFSTWFLFSALAVNLTGIGVKFADDPKDNDRLLFWLVAMPGPAGKPFGCRMPRCGMSRCC